MLTDGKGRIMERHHILISAVTGTVGNYNDEPLLCAILYQWKRQDDICETCGQSTALNRDWRKDWHRVSYLVDSVEIVWKRVEEWKTTYNVMMEDIRREGGA